MLGNLIVFDKNGSDLNTMMLALVLIRTKGVNDSISRFNVNYPDLYRSG